MRTSTLPANGALYRSAGRSLVTLHLISFDRVRLRQEVLVSLTNDQVPGRRRGANSGQCAICFVLRRRGLSHRASPAFNIRLSLVVGCIFCLIFLFFSREPTPKMEPIDCSSRTRLTRPVYIKQFRNTSRVPAFVLAPAAAATRKKLKAEKKSRASDRRSR